MKLSPRVLSRGLLVAGAAVIAIQLVPYGRAHDNPAIVAEPAWNAPYTRLLAARACFDCHSNETQWPWYSNIAPISWLVAHHVDEGRDALNFSEWQRVYEEADEAAETVREGEMPLASYLVLHPHAQLSREEQRALSEGLTATLGAKARRNH